MKYTKYESVGMLLIHIQINLVQPDNPAELGNKVYEMMAMALGGRWGRSEADDAEGNAAESDATAGEAVDAQVVEPSEVRAESDPWSE